MIARGRSRVFPPPLGFLAVFEKFLRISRISSGLDTSDRYLSEVSSTRVEDTSDRYLSEVSRPLEILEILRNFSKTARNPSGGGKTLDLPLAIT